MLISKFSAASTAAILVVPCALPLDDAIYYASSPFDMSPLPPKRAALFANSFLNGVDHAICTQPRFDC